MTGVEAFNELRNWKKIRRKFWSESEYVEVKDLGNGNGELLRHIDKVTLYNRLHHNADLFADLLRDLLQHDDWEMVE